MRKSVKRILALLFTVCAMIGCAAITYAAENTPGWRIVTSGTTPKIQLVVTNSDGTAVQATEGYYNLSKDTTVTANVNGTTVTYTIKAGGYYINNGVIASTKATKKTASKYYKVDAENAFTATTYTKNISFIAADPAATTSAANTYTVRSNINMLNNKIYLNGGLYNGYAYTNKKMVKVEKGVITSTVVSGLINTYWNGVENKFKTLGKYYYKGVIANGIIAKQLYSAGKKATTNGWYTYGKNLYYLKKGVAVTGWHALKSYGGGSTKYAYYFESNGKLRTNFFSLSEKHGKKTSYRYWVQKADYFEVNRTTHTITIFAHHKIGKKNYRAPLIAMICSTSRTATGTPCGTFRLEKTCHRRWFIYTKSTPYHYYQYGTHIKGSPSWFHSTMYKTTNAKKLVKATSSAGYNKLGTNQTTACIRLQCAGARLIYDIACDYLQPKGIRGTTKKTRVYVKVFKSSSAKGAFGKITLKMTTGSLSSSAKIDPTDCKYNGCKGSNIPAIKKLTPDYSKK